ncbi:MAG TPA: type VI secretion system lipoprotein TssJ [Planctomycetota bacterium]|nr:type VI secretion system lipoprotein TssJ [Planctomycetota bacterium]
MRKTAMLGAALTLLSACGGGPTWMYLRGVKPMNENERKESNAVDVRIYQLKDDSRFNQATVDKLWTDEKGALADDLIAMKTITIQPGVADDKATEINLGDLPDSVRFIGVLGLFPKEDDKGPRKLAIAKANSGGILRLTGYHILAEK